MGAASIALLLSTCGPFDSPATGQARTESQSPSAVALRDSSREALSRGATVEADGSFTVDVGGLAPPYLLRVEWTDAGAVRRFYAVSEGRENLDVNALSDVAFRGAHDAADASGDDAADDLVFERAEPDGTNGAAARARLLLGKLGVALAPLLERYGISDPRTDRDAVRVLLRDVKVTKNRRTLVVTNRATGGLIFTGLLVGLPQGTFTAAHMPPGPGAPAPSTCTAFTYSAFGACQPGGTQTRTVLTSSPAGCTGGTPITSQACTYLPPVATCTAFTYSAYGACQPNGTRTRSVLTSSPAGCAGGTPITSQACTYVPPVCTAFTYSAYGACQPDGTRTRTVLTSSPAGCAGGTPITSQACTYVPPIDGAALYTQYCFGCHGNAKKGRTAAAIQDAIDKNTGRMGTPALRALTPAQIAAIAAAP